MKKHWLDGTIWGGEGKPDPFWSTVTPEEFRQILDNDSCLTRELKERFCRLNEINNPPPGRIQIMVNMNDVKYLARRKEK